MRYQDAGVYAAARFHFSGSREPFFRTNVDGTAATMVVSPAFMPAYNRLDSRTHFDDGDTPAANHTNDWSMTSITRAATPEDLDELLHSASRATLAWATSEDVTATPVAFRYQRGQYFVGARPHTLEPGVKAVLLVDEGFTYFELRGIRVRGRLQSVPHDLGNNLDWHEIVPEHVSGWNYGSMRTR